MPNEIRVPSFAPLKQRLQGVLLDDAFARGRYATDASIYQMMPHAVVVPETLGDVEATLDFAREQGIAVLPRGGGTSQCGQTVNHAVVIDASKHLNRLLELDVERRRCLVEPGIVLDELNRQLRPHGLWFPVDVSTSSRATIGGMAGNNSCGGRSIRYGMMRDNVTAIDAILSDGSTARFGDVASTSPSGLLKELQPRLLAMGETHGADILDGFPKVLRRVGGYNVDALIPDAMAMRPGGAAGDGINLSHLLVGSEGTLAYSTAIELKLWPLPAKKIMGICHFPTFYKAMDAAQHLVTLDPVAVELVDDTMIELARSIPIFQPTVEEAVRGNPAALLLVEFAEDDMAENERRLRQLHEMMGDLGFGWDKGAAWRGGVVDAIDPGMQGRIAEWRKSGLNIMMSEKSDAKPVSFLEDCAVELKDLAEYTDKLTAIFDRNGVKGTWYAHASVGCLHVRPVLNMKQAGGAETMRAIAEEAFELVRSFGGSHSGEHGDGIVRSEFNDRMFGPVLPDLFRQVKAMFDPQGMFNPGKITDAPKMDDRELFRFAPGYEAEDFDSVLDWAAWPGAAGGFQGAVEMCNNNGACRKLTGGVMCPSYRATRNERDAVRGRANSLRLAMSGQLGPDAMASDAMAETMKLCVSCKACKRECPVGVDMARMKVEVTAARAAKHGIPLHDRLIGNLPAYAPLASGLSGLSNLVQSVWRYVPGLASLVSRLTGFTTKRSLPKWHSNAFRNGEIGSAPTGAGTPVVLFADTFNRYFEPENLRAAIRVLRAAGYDVFAPTPAAGRPYCCGRTYLSAGMVDKARAEAERLVTALYPLARSGVRIVGLEPSCTLALRDEVPALLGTAQAEAVAEATLTFAELIEADRPDLPVPAAAARRPVKLHGHCHQKAFDLVKPAEAVLRDIAGAEVEVIETSCCGMAGAFGYGRDTYDVSIRMAEASLLPAVRAAPNDAAIVADGTSCRCQIDDGTGREVVHLARHLDRLISGS
ncbi:MAG: FAD-binding and (Fe-S)-binding domain-containing protein [Candidatus Puniceispirillaceae bacterium]